MRSFATSKLIIALKTFQESHHSEVNTTSNPRFLEAEQFVKELSAARVVYCRFTEPIGFVKVNYNQPYSIRGYFIPAQGSSYQFMTYNPIKQIYEVSSVSLKCGKKHNF